jgi:hypothetical protein
MQPARAARVARALWIAWALIVWNVVFDHVIVVAGRAYLSAAVRAVRSGAGYVAMDDWMRPAISRGLWIASAWAAAILLTGLVAVAFASRTPEPAFNQR